MSTELPWLTLSRWAALRATNTLYTFTFVGDPSPQQREAYALAFLHPVVRRQLAECVRAYPDGLRKIEPGVFRRLTIPDVAGCGAPGGLLALAVAELRAGRRSRCEEIAVDFVETCQCRKAR